MTGLDIRRITDFELVRLGFFYFPYIPSDDEYDPSLSALAYFGGQNPSDTLQFTVTFPRPPITLPDTTNLYIHARGESGSGWLASFLFSFPTLALSESLWVRTVVDTTIVVP
jgi:hypothetical protein